NDAISPHGAVRTSRTPHLFFVLCSSIFVFQLFSIVIFGCIANEGYINRPNEVEEFCIFNRNQNACNYGVFMGSMAFLCCVAFLALDVYFPQISSVKDRKKAVLADIGVSAFWSFMWFVGFCFLANQWQVTKQEDNPLREGGDAARAAITFSFFSIFTWKSITMWRGLCKVPFPVVLVLSKAKSLDINDVPYLLFDSVLASYLTSLNTSAAGHMHPWYWLSWFKATW
uniref:Synaptogyrin 1 n=1 Tax=Nothobranchius furzeri TaxID=105023 RepID=A0A8C6KVC7_NOTFU